MYSQDSQNYVKKCPEANLNADATLIALTSLLNPLVVFLIFKKSIKIKMTCTGKRQSQGSITLDI